MNKAAEILEFRFESTAFTERGKAVISGYYSNLVARRILKLESISRKLGNNAFNEEYIRNIEGVFLKFKEFIRQGELNEAFDRRELRNLTYAFDFTSGGENAIFQNPEEVIIALDLLEENWRDLFLIGLFRCYLKNWKSRPKDSFDLLAVFVTAKLHQYGGTRTRYLQLKSNLKFFDEVKGELELGVHLYHKKIPLTKVTDFLKLPEQWISYPYFEGVINSYFQKSQNEVENYLEEIATVLKAHSNHVKGTKANKLIVGKIVCSCVDKSEEIQDKAKDIAFELVGDPGTSAIWIVPDEINSNDRQIIERAREILNEWITRQFISVFFEKCIDDVRRKRFWLKYSKRITRFKVFGPRNVKSDLKKDERIAKYVDGRFHAVDNKSSVSAFMFLLGNHKMIEFSVPGYAFYAYKESIYAPEFEMDNLGSVNEFRNGNMPMLVYRQGTYLHSFSEEGRLVHNDGDLLWESVFAYWIKKIIGIDV